MTETPETLAQRLRKFAAGRTEWRVQHPETGAYCIAYSNNDGYSINPELSAREWLSNHQRDYPNSQFAGYVVKSVIVQTQGQKAMDEAAAALESQAAQIEALRADAERGRYMLKNAGWYRFAEDRTMIVVQVAPGSDLSCYAMREAAIDAAMAAKGE